jgi:hypothetical protein
MKLGGGVKTSSEEKKRGGKKGKLESFAFRLAFSVSFNQKSGCQAAHCCNGLLCTNECDALAQASKTFS